MMTLFQDLCKGPVVFIDDHIKDDPNVKRLIAEIENEDLPVLQYESTEQAQSKMQNLLMSNFVILDWRIIDKSPSVPADVQLGQEAEKAAEDTVVEFIKQLKNVCLAPVFIVSELNTGEIISRLKAENIISDNNNHVFVGSKTAFYREDGKLINTINRWIEENPHIYLGKFWTNNWVKRNNAIFWDLYEINPDWPTLYYQSLKDDGDDPKIGLRDALTRIINAEIDFSGLNETYFQSEVDWSVDPTSSESLNKIYSRLVYTTTGIQNTARPGDIYKKDGYYFLNIRPECDTTRTGNPEIYLLKGETVQPDDERIVFNPEYGYLPKEFQILLYYVDENDIILFNKRKLSIVKHNSYKQYKICRMSTPFITDIQQSYSSYLGRFGTPKYPKNIKPEAINGTE